MKADGRRYPVGGIDPEPLVPPAVHLPAGDTDPLGEDDEIRDASDDEQRIERKAGTQGRLPTPVTHGCHLVG